MDELKQREIWVDNVKVTACIFVVLGHFFQSMTKAGVFPANDLYRWFEQTIYYFHVPLFFICSGYLYQKFSKVNSIQRWSQNVIKKAINLGVPYFAFSMVTWFLKTVFSNSINDKIGGLADILFLHPTSPYWYLYALFFLFLITPTFKSREAAFVGLAVAAVMKALKITGREYGISAVSYILSNEIWFVLGICLSVFDFKKVIMNIKLVIPVIVGVGFMGLSIAVYRMNIKNESVGFGMGLLACFSVILFLAMVYREEKQSVVFGLFAKYTLPIFLMHTLFAAPLRILLFKLNIQNAVAHVVLGLAASFAGPIFAAMIMKKSKWLEVFLYPGKVIKMRK